MIKCEFDNDIPLNVPVSSVECQAQDLRKHSTLRSQLEAKPIGLSLLVAAIDAKVSDHASAFAQSAGLCARVPGEMKSEAATSKRMTAGSSSGSCDEDLRHDMTADNVNGVRKR
jgi:hypothetical protein